MPTQTPEPLARKLRLYQTLAGALTAFLLLGIGFSLYERHLGQPVAIDLDGKPVAIVRNAAAANQILEAAELAKVGQAYSGNDRVRLQTIRLRAVSGETPIDTDRVAQAKLAPLLKLNVRAYVILVNGRRSIALPTEQAAQDTLQLVKDHWAKMPPVTNLVTEPEIADDVRIERIAIGADRTRASAAEAAPYFWTLPPGKTYVIHRGDTGARIAHQNHLSLTDFLTANSSKDMNRLKPGERVNVEKMPLLLTVRVQKSFVRQEKILANAPDYAAGKRAVTYVVTYTNGQETQRDVQDIAVLEKPIAQTNIE